MDTARYSIKEMKPGTVFISNFGSVPHIRTDLVVEDGRIVVARPEDGVAFLVRPTDHYVTAHFDAPKYVNPGEKTLLSKMAVGTFFTMGKTADNPFMVITPQKATNILKGDVTVLRLSDGAVFGFADVDYHTLDFDLPSTTPAANPFMTVRTMKQGAVFQSAIGRRYIKLEDNGDPCRIASLDSGTVISNGSDTTYEVLLGWKPPTLRSGTEEVKLSDMKDGQFFRMAGNQYFMVVETQPGHEISVVKLSNGNLYNFVDSRYSLIDKGPNAYGAPITDASAAPPPDPDAPQPTGPPSLRDVDHLHGLLREAAAHLFSRDLITAEEYEELTS